MLSAALPRARAWTAPATLPRELRDTLFLLAVIGWITALQAPHLPLWCSALTASVLIWRAVLAWNNRPLPGWPWRLAVLAIAVAATVATHRTLLGREAGVTLIVVLLALKTLELRARRDALVVFFLGFFTLLTHFFYSQTLLTAGGILLALLGLLTALVLAHMPVGHPPLWQAARTAGTMALVGAPVMLALFLFFPRLAPLWGLPNDGLTGKSGLSGQMRVGEVAELALDYSIAMRVDWEGGVPPPAATLYFRGPVLTRFDGRQWHLLAPGEGLAFPQRTELEVSGEPVRYTLTLEPSNRTWLLLLDASPDGPQRSDLRAFRNAELQWVTRRPVTDNLRFQAVSYPTFRHGVHLGRNGLLDALELPAGFNPRTLALAAELRRSVDPDGQQPRRVVEAALQRLRSGGYSYTLEPGVYGQHTADEFWFDRKAGFCEHIASAFAVLMRAADIPARVVTGYQGGEFNNVDRFWVLRNSDAHAWTEVWLPGEGWTRVDPTGAVSPGRVGSLARLRPSPTLVEGLIANTVGADFQLRWRDVWEAMNNRWTQWVLNYSQSRQLDLLRELGFKSPNWADLVYTLLALVVGASLAGAAWTLWERARQDPWLRLLAQARARLRRAGLAVPEHATPRQLAQALQALPDRDGRLGSTVHWLLEMEQQRYRPGHRSGLPALVAAFARLQWPRAEAKA